MDPDCERLAGIAFRRFPVSPDREVLADGRPVKLGGRAVDVLMALFEALGTVVSKDTLMVRVWPGRNIKGRPDCSPARRLRCGARADPHSLWARGYQLTGEIRILSASPDMT
jgi:DNA-binding response OmpR family regulator